MKLYLLANPCKKIHCLNGGTCSVNENIEPECDCAPGYEGEFCEEGNYKNHN